MGEVEKKFIFEGNDECLDFINTEIIERGKRVDLLGDFDDLIDWLGEIGYIDPGTAERMLADGGYEREETLKKVKGLRAELRAIIEVLSGGKRLRQSHLLPITEVLKNEATYSSLILISGKAELITHSLSTRYDPLVPAAEAAAELLTKKDMLLVRKCMNPNCMLFFYDESKNHGRKWCSMGRCGNRSKAALHYKKRMGH